MLIGELAQATGISKDTLRFYEQMGLIHAGERPAGSRRYKDFSEQTIHRLTLIQRAKKLGFTLNQIQQTLDSWTSGKLSYAEKIQILEDKMADIDNQVAELYAMKAYLEEKRAFVQQQASSNAS